MIKRQINLPLDQSFFLFGPRQTGKSTLLNFLLKKEKTIYYHLLQREAYTHLISHPSVFREEITSRPEQITHIFIDEIQKAPPLLDEIHSLMESPNPPKFVLTGSSARRLKREQANMLGGRALTYRLFPLTASELHDRFSLLKALRFGTLPSIYLEPSEETAMLKLNSYVETYLKEEVEIEAQIRRTQQFNQFLTVAGHENGHLINYENIAREAGVPSSTVKTYFQILIDTLIGQFLFPYRKSTRKRLSQHPKFYFFDLGVTRTLTKKLTVPIEPHTPDFGDAFEHFIILEVMRHEHYKKLDFTFSYYRTESGAEVDLIIETPQGNMLALEIKGTDHVNASHTRGLRSFSEVSPQAKLCCVSLTPHRIQRGNVLILPWQDLLPWLEQW